MSRERPKSEHNERREQFHDLAICTSTLYKDDPISMVREKLALKLLKNAEALGVRCVVVDGGSNSGFLDQIKAMRHVTLIEDHESGMGESRRKTFRRAFELPAIEYILWTEPEKDDLITEQNLQKMISDLRSGGADIIVPRRKSLDSMTKFQAWIESRANRQASRLAQSEAGEEEVWDFWFGPKMFNREGGRYFADYLGKLDKWDATIKPVIDAYRAGKTVKTVEVDYTYDPAQTESEEHNREIKRKRVAQYGPILKELSDPFWKDR